MLYVRSSNENGREEFYPIKEDNVYVFCEKCGQMVPVSEPAGFIYELGAFASSIETVSLCDDCLDEKCELEDQMLKESLTGE